MVKGLPSTWAIGMAARPIALQPQLASRPQEIVVLRLLQSRTRAEVVFVDGKLGAVGT